MINHGKPYILVQTSNSPYSTSSAIDALDAAFAATNVGLDVRFLFIADGIYQLLTAQDGHIIAHKNLAKKLRAMPLFDIEKIYACGQSILDRDIEQATMDLRKELSVTTVSSSEISILAQQAKQILVF